MKNNWIVFLLVLFISFEGISQEKERSAFYFENTPITEVLVFLETSFDVKFSYQNKLVEGNEVSIPQKNYTLMEVLNFLEEVVPFKFNRINQRYISVVENPFFIDIQQLNDIVVTGYLTSGITKSKNGVYDIDPRELNVLPGLTEADVLESIQLFPGVVSPHETATGFNVRGGRADQNRIIWDGINIYHKGHLFGMISPFNPNSIDKVTFSNKGTHPRYGERLSSVVSISSNESVADAFSGELGGNALNLSAALKLPLVENILSVQGSVRRSYNELYRSFTFDQMAEKVFQNTKIANEESTNNEFYFLDYTLKLNFAPTATDSFSFGTLQIENGLDHLVQDLDTASTTNDVLSIENEGYSGSWNRIWSSKVTQDTRAFLSKYRFFYTLIEEDGAENPSTFDKRNVIFDSGINTEVSLDLGLDNELSIGYQYTLKDVAYAFLDSAELDFVLDTDKRVERTHAVFTNFSYKNPKLIDFNVGARVNYYGSLNAVRFEPRLYAYKQINSYLKFQLTGEIKNQIISEIDETVFSDLALENKIWRLADGDTFPIINSLQISTGLLYNRGGWTVDSDFYYKKVTGVTALSLGFLNPLDSQFHIGEQNILGADIYLKKNFKPFHTWFSYTINDIKSKYEEINDEEYFTSGNSIIHAITASISYKLKGLQLSLGWNWHTGKPFTEAFLVPTSEDLFFNQINTRRLPNYHRMDFSATYNFNFFNSKDVGTKIGISIRNIYDKQNHLSREYRGNNNLTDPIRVEDHYSLGFTPNFLFKLYW